MLSLSLPEFAGIFAGVGFAALLNMSQRKPLSTGIYKHVACGILGYFGGQKLEYLNAQRGREKLLVIEDYVRRHPEDFPEETPKTYGDVLLKWYPVR